MPKVQNDSHFSTVETAEQKRLDSARKEGVPWKKWGPYLSERQWGTVREDCSEGELHARLTTPLHLLPRDSWSSFSN